MPCSSNTAQLHFYTPRQSLVLLNIPSFCDYFYAISFVVTALNDNDALNACQDWGSAYHLLILFPMYTIAGAIKQQIVAIPSPK